MMQTVATTDYVTNQAQSTRCVDDRPDKAGENLGVQLPGGSEHIMDLMLLAIKKTGEEVSEQTLFELVERVYDSAVAKEHRLVLGLHIDDEHGHLDEDACADRVMGCGYDKVRGEVLARMGVQVVYGPGERITKGRALGWGVQVLTGEHASEATAAINKVVGKTLKTKALWTEGRVPSFNHDIWVVEVLLEPMVSELLHSLHKPEAAEQLRVKALEWSEQLYRETLSVLTTGKLGETLVEIG